LWSLHPGYELAHLKSKLAVRDLAAHTRLSLIEQPDLHPLFTRVSGGIEAWEVLTGFSGDERTE
jgi:hypothetical protein